MDWVLWHCFFGNDFIAARAGVTGIRSSLVIHQTSAITQECVLGRNRWASRLGLCGFARVPCSFSLAPQPLEAENVPLQSSALRIVRVCWPGDSLGSPLIGLCQQPWLSHSLSRSAPLLETAQGDPSALQLLPAAVTVEAGSKVTGNNERDSWALNEHGGPVQRSRHRCGNFRRPSLCRISLQRTSKPVVTRTLSRDGRDSFLELLSCALRYIGYAAKSMHGSYMSKTSSQQKPSPRKPRHWDS